MDQKNAEPDLADDILRGAEEIRRFVGHEDERQTYHLLQTGQIPATKEGRTWVTTKSRLRKHYNETRYVPQKREVA